MVHRDKMSLEGCEERNRSSASILFYGLIEGKQRLCRRSIRLIIHYSATLHQLMVQSGTCQCERIWTESPLGEHRINLLRQIRIIFCKVLKTFSPFPLRIPLHVIRNVFIQVLPAQHPTKRFAIRNDPIG